MNNSVYVIGYGITKFGEHFELNPSSLVTQALTDSISSAKIEKKEIKSVFLGSFVSSTNSQTSVSSSCFRDCNLSVPITRIEAGNASGAGAFHQAYIGVKSGFYDCVAVIGVEKFSDFVKSSTIEKILGTTIDYHWEFEMGATLTSLYAILTQAHMREFDTTFEQLASVPVKNHKNGILNEYAQFRREISMERFLNAKRISEPIGRFDPATLCDGAAAVILASSDFIQKHSEVGKQTEVLSSSQASDSIALHHRQELTSLSATKSAAKQAYDIAGISSSDIDVAEVHDSYPIGEILAIEDLGFFEKGEGGKVTLDGRTNLNAEISINTSGGLKSRGDPFGATGIAQIIEIVQQLNREADKRQVKDAKYGLTQNVLGTGAASYVNILSRKEEKK